MSDSAIHNCDFELECPADASQLKETSDPSVRFCDQCQRNVYRCSSTVELAHWSRLGECVSLVLLPPDRPRLSTDDVVRITSGAFENFEATIVKVNEEDHAAEVFLNIFGRHVPFWIDQCELAKVEDRNAAQQ